MHTSTYIHEYMYTCIYTHTHSCIYPGRAVFHTVRHRDTILVRRPLPCIFIYVYACIHTYTYAHTGYTCRVCIYICIHCMDPRKWASSLYMHVCVYIHMHKYIHVLHNMAMLWAPSNYRSLLQNIVFFLGLFCKRDL